MNISRSIFKDSEKVFCLFMTKMPKQLYLVFLLFLGKYTNITISIKNITYFFNFLVKISFSSNCVHRNYGHGSTVCVCNANECDTIAPIRKTPSGTYSIYTTSKSGHRFTRRNGTFDHICTETYGKKIFIQNKYSKREKYIFQQITLYRLNEFINIKRYLVLVELLLILRVIIY